MKNGVKRLIAMLLLVCLLASFVVPATFADTGNQGTVADTYDFVLYDAANPKSTNAMVGGSDKKLGTYKCSCGCKKLFKEHLAEKYDDLGWMILEHNISDENEIAFRANGGWGLRPKGKDCWIAIKLKVSAPGTYQLKYTSSYASSQSIEAYVFTAQELSATPNGKVADLMASANVDNHKLGQLALSATDMSGTFENNWEIAADGEQIVVFKLVNPTMYLGKLELIAAESTVPGGTTAAPATEATENTTNTTTAPSVPSGSVDTTPGAVVKYYDFTVEDAVIGARSVIGFGNDCQCSCGKKVSAHLADQNLGWTHLENTLESIQFVKGGDHPPAHAKRNQSERNRSIYPGSSRSRPVLPALQ